LVSGTERKKGEERDKFRDTKNLRTLRGQGNTCSTTPSREKGGFQSREQDVTERRVTPPAGEASVGNMVSIKNQGKGG